jgi:methyltransferase-like protein
VVGEELEGGEVAAIEGEEEITEPAVLRAVFETVKDRVKEKFAEVVD